MARTLSTPIVMLTADGRSRGAAILARLLAAALLMSVSAAGADAASDAGSGLAVPRFVSLKSDKVNVRAGPTKENDVAWIYTRAGLPVEITAEYENWRRIRDWEGSEGWVWHSMLSGRRTGLVQPNAKAPDEYIPIRASADPNSGITARLQRGVLGKVKQCTGNWCRIVGEGFDGWVEQERLWGVYPHEKID
jgi:SH3-like domain-containing protein